MKHENCLVGPPVSLITKAIHYLYANQAVATIVVSFWPSSNFWPIIARKYVKYMTGYQQMNGKKALQHGRNTNSILGSHNFYGDVLAIRMNFALN